MKQNIKISSIVFFVFVFQLFFTLLASKGMLPLNNTTVQHEDLVTSMMLCTFFIVISIERLKQ